MKGKIEAQSLKNLRGVNKIFFQLRKGGGSYFRLTDI